MSKLPKQHKFVDLSDYGRPAARFLVGVLKDTNYTPINVTSWFIISGLIAIACMFQGYFVAAAFFLILKSILDAADGELARVKKTPSYTGRYYDSVADIILNLLFLLTIWFITDASLLYTLIAFVCVQLQGTLYNYYYVILRNKVDGDTTSRVFEDQSPIAFKGEKQSTVDRWFSAYNFLYKIFDVTIYQLDKTANQSKPFPNWFMTAVSIYGLGFQLLIISVMLILHLENYIISFFIAFTSLLFLFVGIRRWLNKS